MTLHVPVFIQPTGGDPTINLNQQNLRNWNSSIRQIATAAADLEGVVGVNSFLVTQRGAGANFSVDVAAGRAYVTDDEISNGGTYFCFSDATVNVATPGAPGSGTRHHRIILRLRTKSENGSWTTYDFLPDIVTDGGGGLPSTPGSAISLATVDIATGQGSVTNANITDFRARCDTVTVSKPGNTSRSGTSVTADPDLVLNNLQASALYEIQGNLFWDGDANPGGLLFTLSISTGSIRWNTRGDSAGFQSGTQESVFGAGTGTRQSNDVHGLYSTGAVPANVTLNWARLSATANNTVLQQFSYLNARQIG